MSRETHKLLAAQISLPQFESLLAEACHGVNAPWGRIPLYILVELDRFFLPHFCYNGATNRLGRATFRGITLENELGYLTL